MFEYFKGAGLIAPSLRPEMRRFKRTLGGSGPPLPLLPVAKPKAGPLHEGFAIPVEEETPAPEASASDVRDRSNGEANPYSRGNSKAALAAASNRAKCQQILAEGALADSSRGPLASRRSLWAQLAIRAGYPDPFHITPDLMYAVMGALKQAGYRSAYQYLEAAQAQHIALGYSWSPQLQQAKRSAIRSCERFLGIRSKPAAFHSPGSQRLVTWSHWWQTDPVGQGDAQY